MKRDDRCSIIPHERCRTKCNAAAAANLNGFDANPKAVNGVSQNIRV
jgi:hypothetical protein